MSYSGSQVKNPNGKIQVQIAKADIYNTSQSYENIVVKIQIGSDVKVTPSCPYSQKNITWADNFEVTRKQNEDNVTFTLINQAKKGEEILGSASVEINQFMQRARKMDFQADLQLNGKNTSSLQLKILFTKFTDAENLALQTQKIAGTDGKKGEDTTTKKLQDGLMNEASKKLKENEIQTNYVSNVQAQNCKYLITISSIKANFTRDTDVMSKMDPYIRIRVSEEINFKTKVINGGGKTPEWKEQLQIPVGLEELIVFQALDNDVDSDDLIGSGSVQIQNFRAGDEIKNIPLEFEKKKVGELIITLNCQIQNTYEKQTNLKGKIIIRNISTNLKSGISNNQLKFTNSTENRCSAVIPKSDKITQYAEDMIIIPIKDKSQTNLQVSLQSVSKKGIEAHGSAIFDMKNIIDKEKWYIQEQISIVGKDKKEIGHLLADIQYIDFAEHEDEKLFKLQQNEGKIRITNMRAYLTRDTDTFGKMDPYCILAYNGTIQKTNVHESGGKEPIWKDNIFEIPQFIYQKDRILKLNVLEVDKGSQDDEVGNGQIDLTQFVQKKGKYLGQKVEIFFQGKSAGQVNFDLESEENKELLAYLEKKKKEKELEELQKKKLEEELKAKKAKEEEERKKKEEEERKKKEEEDKKKKLQEEEEKKKKQEEELKKKKQQEEDEKKKKEELDKKKKEEEDKKKKEDEERKKKEDEERKKKEEEDKKKQQNLSNQEMDLKKQNEEKERQRLQQENEMKKKKEEEELKRKQDEEMRLKREKEEALRRQKEEEERKKNENQDDDYENEQFDEEDYKKERNTSQSPSPSRNNKSYAEYKIAKSNLEQGHGFGMSEFQSATSLQKSSYAFSMPKSRRFQSQSATKREDSNGPSLVHLPSIFEANPKKGASFGVSQRNTSAKNTSPGPGSYTQDSVPRTSKGYTFGVSRSNCKNYINPEFGSPKKNSNQRFESSEKQNRQHSQNRTVEQEYVPKQNNVYIQQNKYLIQQQQHKRNASHDQRRNNYNNINNNPQQYINNNIFQQNPRQNLHQRQNNSYVVYSNPKHNYHFTASANKQNY